MTEVLPQPWELEPGEHCERLATHPHDATAAIAGISLDALREISFPAMQTCRAAADAFPEQPRFLALLARATFAAGREAEAIALYREAADRGDLRALVSLGLLTERQDAQLAISYYERAAEGGSTDGAINLASALMDGKVIPQDIPRAIEMFRQAAEAGAPLATFNLGVLALEGTNGTPAEALELFRRAARDGFPPGYRAAASMLAEGSAVPGNPAAAAELLLRGAAEDDGEIIKRINNGDDQWLGDTIAEVQERLAAAGIYDGPRDGIAGPEFVNALWAWRRGGFDASVLTADLPADVP
jgi:TPR repeat protein